jgi:hypothetical protein
MFKRHSNESQTAYGDVASGGAESVRRDFGKLIELFSGHLDALAEGDGDTRRHLSEAKAAAERGLKLSDELILLMRTNEL